jgi:Tol biopolymer transport system component
MKKRISIVLVLALCMVAEIAKADFTFGTPASLGQTVNSSYNELNPSISADGLSLYFISNRTGGVGGTDMFQGCDIWVTTRETPDDPWGAPVNLGPTINSSLGECGVSISSDGLSLYFDVLEPGSFTEDMYVATRATIDDDWSDPVNLGPAVNTSADDCYVNISADGLALYFTSNRSGGYGNYDLWVTTRETIYDPWGSPVNLGPMVNTPAGEGHPGISADSRIFFFVSASRPGGYGDLDIWMTRRATTNDEWGEAVNLGPIINSSAFEGYPNVSADGSTLYFRYSQSGRYTGGDIWQAPIIPIVDFNGDGIVDGVDVRTMADYWGTDDSLCDIGPMPWGDGIVDVQDLLVLADYIAEQVDDPTLVAHWPLDEMEGMTAHDSAGDHDATVVGEVIWRPEGGQVDGALELDGTSYVTTDFAVNPAEGPFSIFVWVNGGISGQVIVAQADGTKPGAVWLSADPANGKLMTNLMFPLPPLMSDAVITDGQWHRVALVWDGARRHLYVDDVAVASDTVDLPAVIPSDGSLRLAADKNLTPGTFFTGLIDDVRIYNRAVKP